MANLFIDVLRTYTQAGRFAVHDFVVMPNHVHLLLTVPGDISVERAVQLIKGNFSFRAKRELGYHGEVWQRGFSDVRITRPESLLQHRNYIEKNPVKAGLSETPENYAYSSAHLRMLKRTGAEAQSHLGAGSARLKSCPDTVAASEACEAPHRISERDADAKGGVTL